MARSTFEAAVAGLGGGIVRRTHGIVRAQPAEIVGFAQVASALAKRDPLLLSRSDPPEIDDPPADLRRPSPSRDARSPAGLLRRGFARGGGEATLRGDVRVGRAQRLTVDAHRVTPVP
jgi:hypothetical protein